jgi:predicted amidohydrolase YtcJ
MLEAYLRRASREGRLPLPVQMLFVSGDSGLFAPPTDRLAGPVTGDRVDGVAVGALKLFADGGSRCAVCVGLAESLVGVGALVGRAARSRRPGLLMAASAPERPQWGADRRLHLGYLHYPPGALAALCAEAHARGFQLAIHAACNAGIEAVIGALAPLPAGNYRHRVEHLVSLDHDQMHRLANIGVIGVVQPLYIEQLGDEWEAMPAPPRLKSVPLRDLLDAGVILAGSSDAPIAPYRPLAGMQAAMTRRTASGRIHQGDQAITPLEALRLWTTGGAHAANRPGEIGVLRPGARADCVVLSANPLATPPERFETIRVEHTILGGTTVYVRR